MSYFDSNGLDWEVTQTIEEARAFRHPPVRGDWQLFVTRPDPESGAVHEVYISPRVTDRMREQEYLARPRETMGLLVGRTFDGPSGQTHTRVTDLVAPDASIPIESNPVGVEASASSMVLLESLVEDLHPVADRVGWWHSHPAMPAFFSPRDCRQQEGRGEFGIGIVIGGQKNATPRFRVFVGVHSREAHLTRFPSPTQDPALPAPTPETVSGQVRERVAKIPITPDSEARESPGLRSNGHEPAPAEPRILPPRHRRQEADRRRVILIASVGVLLAVLLVGLAGILIGNTFSGKDPVQARPQVGIRQAPQDSVALPLFGSGEAR